MNRKLTAQQLRDIVGARLMREGDALALPTSAQYLMEQERVRDKLAALSRADIFKQFPRLTRDLVS